MSERVVERTHQKVTPHLLTSLNSIFCLYVYDFREFIEQRAIGLPLTPIDSKILRHFGGGAPAFPQGRESFGTAQLRSPCLGRAVMIAPRDIVLDTHPHVIAATLTTEHL